MPGAGDELFDFVDHTIEQFLIECLKQMIVSGKLDKPSAGNFLRQIAAPRDRNCIVADSMQNQRRNPNGRKNGADVDLVVGLKQRDDGAGTCGGPLKMSEPMHESGIATTAGSEKWN